MPEDVPPDDPPEVPDERAPELEPVAPGTGPLFTDPAAHAAAIATTVAIVHGAATRESFHHLVPICPMLLFPMPRLRSLATHCHGANGPAMRIAYLARSFRLSTRAAFQPAFTLPPPPIAGSLICREVEGLP